MTGWISALTPGNSFGSSSTCSATRSDTFWSTGMGWYGEPAQQGCGTPLVHSRVFSVSSAYDMPSKGASRCSTGAPPPGCWSRVIMSTETTRAVVLVTSRPPTSSRIWPRTAGTITFLVWFCSASLVNELLFMTCR